MKNSIKDIKIHGQGISTGGKYNTVSIMGEGKINGNVDCVNLKIYGDGEIDGDLKATSTVNIKGHTAFRGNLEAKNIKIQGEVEVNGELIADEAVISGNISLNSDCNAEIFTLEGGLTIDGLLNADVLKINLYWPSKVHEIGGTEITVKKEAKLSFLGLKDIIMPSGANKKLTADIIEGDNINLENTQAKVVRGNNITIGSGCKIELVEYKDSFKNDEGAEIITYRKM
jgi:cytoskeletal protein CcmA (bactofilin family)